MEPIPSAACIIVRSSSNSNDIEVLLIKRKPKQSFGSEYAFPGGKVEDDDYPMYWSGICPSLPIYNSGSHNAHGYNENMRKITAIREVFEEVGIVLTTKITNVV